MNKRGFLKRILGIGVASAVSVPAAAVVHPARPERLRIQTSPLAGYQYHQAERLWQQMKPGDKLGLLHAPWNPHDKYAVEVWWRGSRIGHLPRRGNIAVAQMLAQGEPLYAVITRMNETENPWERIALTVWRDPHGFVPVPDRRPRDERQRRKYGISKWPKLS